MTEIQKWQIIIGIVALVTGGLAGSFLTILYNIVRNRIQPVGKRVELVTVFGEKLAESRLDAKVTITGEAGTQYPFENLFLYEIQIINKGNQDIGEFKFGITLKDGDKAIFLEGESPSRHHIIDHTPIHPAIQQHEIDIVLKPFNRKDNYSFRLYVVVPASKRQPSEIELYSSLPIRFVNMPTKEEIIIQGGTLLGELLAKKAIGKL